METLVIDCDALPETSLAELRDQPGGPWEVTFHRPTGQFTFDPSRINLRRAPAQEPTDAQDDDDGFYGSVVMYDDVRRAFQDEPVLNACVFDFLHAHPELIPAYWHEIGDEIVFWGTEFKDRWYGLRHVRAMLWCGPETGWLFITISEEDDLWGCAYSAILS